MDTNEDKVELLLSSYPDAFAFVNIRAEENRSESSFLLTKTNKAFDKILFQLGLDKKNFNFAAFLKNSFDEKLYNVLKNFKDKDTATRQNIYTEEHYSPLLHRWYQITVYIAADDILAFIFHDITYRKHSLLTMEKISMLAGKEFSFPAEDKDFEIFTEDLLELSGAKFVACNSYEKNGSISTTRSISGIKALINKAADILGFEITGKQWETIPRRLGALSAGKMVRFDNLFDASFGALSKQSAFMLEKIFGIGEVYVIEIRTAGIMIGDFIIFMPARKRLENKYNIEAYVKQAGSIIIAENTLHKQLRFQKMVNSIFTSFVNASTDDIDQAIDHVLQLSGEFFNADRSYLFRFCDDCKTMDNTHEWCAPGVEPQKDSITDMPLENLQWAIKQITDTEFLQIEDVEELPPEAAYDKEEFRRQDIKSFFLVRLHFDEKVIGFIGYDAVKEKRIWEEEEIALARVIAEVIAISLHRNYAEEELKDSENKFRTYTDSAPLAIFVVDQNGRFLEANKMARQMSGFTEGEILNMSVMDFLEEDFLNQGGKLFQDLLENDYVRGDIKIRRKEGGSFWIDLLAKKISDDRFIAFYIDINENKKNEETLEQQNREIALNNIELKNARDSALEASKAKSVFLSTMSHEIRTPMNAILGMADLLAETELNPEQRRYIDISRSSGENLLSLINDILDISKIEAGHIKLYEGDFSLPDLVEKSVDIISMKAKEKGLELHLRMDQNISDTFNGDADRLQQVILNLLGNAVKFTQKGEIVLEFREIGQNDDGSHVMFTITDTGIGIPRKKLDIIFEEFTQVDSSNTRQYEGSGLGLNISRHLVRLMGGDIGVMSVLEQGSTFYFTVTLKKAQNDSPPHTISETFALDLKGIKILVADDNKTNRLILKETLIPKGAEVREKDNGIEVLEELIRANENQSPYHLVLLDVMMPRLDGFSVAVKIKEELPETKIIIVSSAIEPLKEGSSSKADIDAYLMKPVKRELLFKTIGSVLKNYLTSNISDTTVTEDTTIAEKPENRTEKEREKVEPYTESTAKDLLLAEDNSDNRMLIKAFLKKTNYIITTAENGEAAVNKVKEKYEDGKKRYSIILMDIQMPVMDGYAATREIRNWEAENHISPTPIVALTAYALKNEIQKALDAGFDAHLAKPVNKKTLIETIEKYMLK